jgi:hypothetical protein
MSLRRRPSHSLRYAYPVRVGRVDEHCRIAIRRFDGRKERGDFGQREKSVAGMAQEDGNWQTRA